MAEIATIARPYAEALFQVAKSQDLAAWGRQLDALAQVAQDADLRQFADHPMPSPSRCSRSSPQPPSKTWPRACRTSCAP